MTNTITVDQLNELLKIQKDFDSRIIDSQFTG